MKPTPNDPRTPEEPEEPDDFDQDDYFADCPYCLCDEQPTEEEEMDNVCDCCGKPLS